MTTAAVTKTKTDAREYAFVASWTGLTTSVTTGDPLEMPQWADRSVQIIGTFGSGGTIVIEGSNDGTNYTTLTDPQGNAISKTAASIEQIEEITRYVRPRVTVSDGTTALSVYMLITGHRGW